MLVTFRPSVPTRGEGGHGRTAPDSPQAMISRSDSTPALLLAVTREQSETPPRSALPKNTTHGDHPGDGSALFSSL